MYNKKKGISVNVWINPQQVIIAKNAMENLNLIANEPVIALCVSSSSAVLSFGDLSSGGGDKGV